jgi:Zn-dependent protease with chaperone function
MRRLDRRMTNAQARRDLQRWRAPGTSVVSIGIGYAIILAFASTCIYLLLYVCLAAALYFGYRFVIEAAWLGVGICAIGAAAVIYMLFPSGLGGKIITARRSQFPRLSAALDEVSRRVGAPVPHRVILTPSAEAFVLARRPLRRLFRRELVLGLGVGALPLLSEVDLKAILAHELAHYRHGDATLHRYYAHAETALARLVYMLSSNASSPRHSRYRFYARSTAALVYGEVAMDLLTLPVGAFWIVFHFLRLRCARLREWIDGAGNGAEHAAWIGTLAHCRDA